MVKTRHFQCRGSRFDLWSGNKIPHAVTKSPHATVNILAQLQPGAAKLKKEEDEEKLMKQVPFYFTQRLAIRELSVPVLGGKGNILYGQFKGLHFDHLQ